MPLGTNPTTEALHILFSRKDLHVPLQNFRAEGSRKVIQSKDCLSKARTGLGSPENSQALSDRCDLRVTQLRSGLSMW